MELNTRLETVYGAKAKISKKVSDEDMATVLNFIGDDETNEDDRFLANLWLDKFKNFWTQYYVPGEGNSSSSGNGMILFCYCTCRLIIYIFEYVFM